MRLARDRVVSPPLGWLLSRAAREWMDGSLVADAPASCGEKSENHPDGFHYILFEDGHFERLRVDGIHGADDHLYRNHEGEVAAGVDSEDAVIGDSHHQP